MNCGDSIKVMVMTRILSRQKPLVIMLLSFAVVGCSNMNYVNKSSLREMGLTKTRGGLSAKSYGALSLKTNSSENNKDNSTLILLGKQKSLFFAETMVHERKDKNSLIKKSFLTLGADKKNKGAVVQFRIMY